MSKQRLTFGIEELDALLGGGLLPGTLTVLAGSTGAGKTQLGLRWANQGAKSEGRRGIVCDLTSRGDSQNHSDYALGQFDWTLSEFPIAQPLELKHLWEFERILGDYLHPFSRSGKRVTRRDLEEDDWHAWKSDLARVLRQSVSFFYQNFARGTRRVVFDGIEPAERFSESIQFEFFEYLYHQVIRKEDEWAARELLRELYRANEAEVMQHRYDHKSVGCVCLYTTPHVMLDHLLAEPIGEGDIFANANTIILMGRTRDEGRLGRALSIAKHRGSACSDDIRSYRLTGEGMVFD